MPAIQNYQTQCHWNSHTGQSQMNLNSCLGSRNPTKALN